MKKIKTERKMFDQIGATVQWLNGSNLESEIGRRGEI
jgi:hypothetical protein